jgi:ubiquinone/menaquinone biosynthesis C-methylase UbiE
VAHGICPWWLGYTLISPLRRILEDPVRLLASRVREGMTVLEPGCGMGYFTLPLARMVGPHGRVVAIDLQERMLAALARRAVRAGLSGRIETRRAEPSRLGVDDLHGCIDLAVALHVVHEVPDTAAFLVEIRAALRPGACLLVVEPKAHVGADEFERTLAAAGESGLTLVERPASGGRRTALLRAAGPSGPDDAISVP